MKSVTNQATVRRLDAEWKRLCHAAATTAPNQEKAPQTEKLVIPAAVQAKAMDAWRASLTKILKPRPLRNFLIAFGIFVALNVPG
jgi:hypothetical protein